MDLWKRCSNKAWTLGVAIGACFLALGVYHDQFIDIYRKAIMICLECIGIG